MASFHLSVKTMSRSDGRSATAAAAYRSGVSITDARTGEVHDYTRKRGIVSTDLVLPADAPAWASDRSALWNAAEQGEKRKNSTVAREFEIALPTELTAEQRRAFALKFAREVAERHGCAVDVSIHAPHRQGDDRNHHAHVLCTTRRLTADGFTVKTRELDDPKSGEVIRWRERFAELQNDQLALQGHEVRVDHRSLAEQGIEREPTRHLGPAATGYERRTGEPSWKRLALGRETLEASANDDRADELGRAVRQIDQSIVDLSSELAAAQKQRALMRDPETAKAVQEGVALAREAFKAAQKTPQRPERQWSAEREADYQREVALLDGLVKQANGATAAAHKTAQDLVSVENFKREPLTLAEDLWREAMTKAITQARIAANLAKQALEESAKGWFNGKERRQREAEYSQAETTWVALRKALQEGFKAVQEAVRQQYLQLARQTLQQRDGHLVARTRHEAERAAVDAQKARMAADAQTKRLAELQPIRAAALKLDRKAGRASIDIDMSSALSDELPPNGKGMER